MPWTKKKSTRRHPRQPRPPLIHPRNPIDTHWRNLTIAQRELRLRSSATKEELLLKSMLEADPRTSGRFKFQAHCCGYYADFLFRREKLIVELDGSVHATQSARIRDRQRTRELATSGYRVIRFWNSQLRHPNLVMERICNELSPPPVIRF